MAKSLVESVDDLLDFISYVVLYAPDEFPEEDYLSAEEQMTLDTAFRELSRGLRLALDEGAAKSEESVLRGTLAESKQAYERGDDAHGAQLLQRFETELFG